MSRRRWRTWWPLLVVLAMVACGREEAPPETGDGGAGFVEATYTFTIPVGVQWVNTGIVLERGMRLEIVATGEDGSAPLGSLLPDEDAPLPLYGVDGLIGRVGRSGYPFAIPGSYELQGSSLTAGEVLYLGRNMAPPEPVIGLTEPTNLVTSAVQPVEIYEPTYESVAYTVTVRVRRTDAPAPLTPLDGFVDTNPNPIFDWDELDNASQYVLELSDFPDFRRILFTVNINTTSVNTAALGIDPTNPTAVGQGPNLQEGVYYWRVRAQINRGRLLAPVLTWTERSVPFRLGIETEAALPPPQVLSPKGEEFVVVPGTRLLFEFAAEPDASGLLWRFRFYTAPCGEAIDTSATTPARLASPWLVFQQWYQPNRIAEPPLRYASFVSPLLEEGEWLVRIETRDGADVGEERLGSEEVRFTAGCQ